MSADTTYVIIGNGVAGTTAAQTLREGDPQARIVLIAAESYPLYNRVALPRLLKNDIPERRVFIRSVEWHEQNRIELKLGTRVISVDVDEQSVLTDLGEEFSYDKLLIATGGTPRTLPVPGGDLDNIHTFQTFDDTKKLIRQIEQSERAVTVGGSYIAYELTEGFRSRGLKVTWLIRGNRFLRRILDEEGGALVDLIARSHGVQLIYGEEVARVNGVDGRAHEVVTTEGKKLPVDIVGVGLGLRYNTGFLENTPVKVNRGVVTNEYLETNVPNVYAAGDVAEFFDVVINTHNIMGTWNNAQLHGRVAARNMLGDRTPYIAVPTYSTTMFDSTMSVMGITPEVHPNLESSVRVNLRERTYRKLFFLENRLVGAVLIGEMKGRRDLLDLIKKKVEAPTRADKEALLQV